MSELGNKAIMAKNILCYMARDGKTRSEICSDLGFSYTTFTDWVNARTYPRIDKIEILANYFGISKSDLVEEKPTTISSGELNADKIKLLEDFDALSPENQAKLVDLARIFLADQQQRNASN